MGKLQRELRKGKYHMFRSAPIFESDFVQITKRGKLTDMQNRGHFVTVGVTCTSPILPIPDVMLLARQATSCDSQAPKRKNRKAEEPLELTRLIPLKFVQISVHDLEKQQLRLKLATGRSFYLQLCAPLDAREDLFTSWERLIYLLQLPFESNSGTYDTPPEDILCLPELADADSSSLATSDTYGRDDWGQVSIRNIYAVAELAGATSAAHASGEGDQPSSRTSAATPKVCTPETRS
ncbi:protein FAM71A, partial [Heterocephalus glaber]|uniref:Protein FAM71A n=1 Tax=Heterocephalus glaber TaxID=10181 RepID=A0AAX6SJS5_HETGA